MPDLLGSDYEASAFNLNDGSVATLVALPAPNPRGAILYLHGFVDYFFHDHVARHFVDQGWTFAGLDLRACGRSIRPGDERWYIGDLTTYYEEIDRAIEHLRTTGHDRIVLMGHSTGGLVASIWAHDRRDAGLIESLVLTSPWLDLQQPWFMRTVGTWVVRGVALLQPLRDAPQALTDIYPQSVHAGAHGEWDFDLYLKPVTPVPVKLGFLATVRRQQARLHRGLDVRVPVLMLRSTQSRLDLRTWDDVALRSDTVLDVEQMAHWLPSIGRDTTDVPIDGAVHDVLLSREPARSRALAEISDWLTARLG